MRAPNFTDLTREERMLLYREEEKLDRVLEWSAPSRDANGQFLRCKVCNKSVAFLGEGQWRLISQIYQAGQSFYMMKRFYFPHLATAEHKYNATLSNLACEG